MMHLLVAQVFVADDLLMSTFSFLLFLLLQEINLICLCSFVCFILFLLSLLALSLLLDLTIQLLLDQFASLFIFTDDLPLLLLMQESVESRDFGPLILRSGHRAQSMAEILAGFGMLGSNGFAVLTLMLALVVGDL